MNSERIAYLIKGLVEGNADPGSYRDELQELTGLLKNDESFEVTAQVEELLKQYDTADRQPLHTSDIEDMAHAVLQADHTKRQGKVTVIRLWRRVAAAAVIILMLGAGGYFYFNNRPLHQAQGDKTIAKTNDVPAPAINKAMITLAGGKQIVLDSAGNGILAEEGNINVTKLADGEIVYNESGSSPSGEAGVGYNTLTNPRGSKVINLTLADGSKVWLNAESSLKYPTAFMGKERKVEITGEAYFEVTHNAAMPFVVSLPSSGGAGGGSVKVLGTHFNVNTYDDEAELRITLLEGSVQVTNRQSSILIKPGQQAQLKGSEINVVNADVEQAVAWKNGMFKFKDASIETIMKQLEKWYDVEVDYEGNVTEHFVSTIPRNVPISEVMKILETTGRVHFKIEGKKIIVTK